MTPREIVLEQIAHREVRPVPYTLPIEGDVQDRLDDHYGGGHWREKLTTYIVQMRAVDTDPKEPISDTHVRDPYGGIWRQDLRPWHLETPPLAEPTFDGYEFPSPEKFYRPEAKARAMKTCEENPGLFRIAYLGWGLFERSWNLRGFENVLIDSVANPEFYEEMLDRLTELYLAFIEYTVDLPVDAILFGDDWGDQRGVILGPDRWRRFLKPRWARLYQATRDAGKIAISHCCGSAAAIMPDIIEIGLDVLESVQPEAAGMNPYELKATWGDKLAFWGGLGSQSILPFGTPDQIRDEVRKLKRQMGTGGGYILAPAKPLQPETPIENAVAAVEAFAEGG